MSKTHRDRVEKNLARRTVNSLKMAFLGALYFAVGLIAWLFILTTAMAVLALPFAGMEALNAIGLAFEIIVLVGVLMGGFVVLGGIGIVAGLIIAFGQGSQIGPHRKLIISAAITDFVIAITLIVIAWWLTWK
jgi:hypothetical protein